MSYEFARLMATATLYDVTCMAYEPVAKKLDNKITSARGQDLAWVAGSAIPILASIGVMYGASRFTRSRIFSEPGPLGKGIAAVALAADFWLSDRNPFLYSIEFKFGSEFGVNVIDFHRRSIRPN